MAGCDYSGRIQDGKHPETGEYAFDYTYSVHPTRLALSPFTAEVETRFETREPYEYTQLDFEIVMKDGSSQRYGWCGVGYGHIAGEAENGRSSYVIRFSSPINLDQIDHIIVGSLEHGDTLHKVYP